MRAPALDCVAAALTLAFSATLAAQTLPAAPPVRDVRTTYFGTDVSDPYRYFEDLKNPEVEAWMKAQAAYTTATLARVPGRAELRKEIAVRGDAVAARVANVQVSGKNTYFEKRLGTENVFKLYVRAGGLGRVRLLVDPDKVADAKGDQHSAIDYYAPSPDNHYVAYGVSVGGSEQSVLRFVDVRTGKTLPDRIDRANYGSPSWLPDGRVIYSRLQKLAANAPVTDKYQNQRLFVHTLGTNPDQDPQVFGTGTTTLPVIGPAELVVGLAPVGSQQLLAFVVNGVQREFKVWTAPVAALNGPATPWQQIVDTTDQVTDLAVHGDTLFLLTHRDAARYKVLRTTLPNASVANGTTVVAPGESVVNGIAAAADALYVRKMNGGNSELFRLPYAANGTATQVALPFIGDIDAMATDVRVPGVTFSLGGWTRFGGYYAYSPLSNRVTDTRLQPQGKYDNPGTLTATEVRCTAQDGTPIPLSIVHRKGLKLDGSNPTILDGYGAYGISQTPFFRPTWLPWFDRGGVLAVAHVRGGGEYGEDWYKAGYQATKPNTWRDGIACAEWLIANKYTSTPKLSIMGGSAGGIFVGRAITERPDLFGAAVNQVPVSDLMRAEFSANGVPNIPEFGTVTTEAGFKGLLAMSPYHAVKDGTPYPAVLLTTGFNDPRVDSWEAGKMAARLQAATTSGKPILLRIDFDEGHGIGSSKKAQYDERADTFAFLFWQAGIAGFQPAAAR